MATEQGRKYAMEAMRELIKISDNPFGMADYIARQAWEYSDAMMLQEGIRE